MRPLDRAWNAALLVVGISLALWFAVQLLAQIWGWLLLTVSVIALIVGGIWWLRWRARRW
jgi:hypothetical protein